MHFLGTLLLIALVALVAFALFTAFVARKVTQAFPPEGDFLQVDGERIHYRSLGDGPPLVFVHGLAGQMKHFDYLPLEDLAQRWRLVLIDRPGSGRSLRVDAGKCGVTAQGRLVLDFIGALRLPQPPLLVGHSLGGAIALSAALQDPQAVAGVALLAPLTHQARDVPEPFRLFALRRAWLRRFIAHTVAVPLAILTSRSALAFMFGPESAPADFPTRGGGLMGLRPAAVIGASEDMLGVEGDLPYQQRRYGELRVPVSVLFGDGDRVLDWRTQGEGLRGKLPSARLELIADAGHMLPVSRPQEVAAWLEDFARRTLA